jgi:hypothetical protein
VCFCPLPAEQANLPSPLKGRKGGGGWGSILACEELSLLTEDRFLVQRIFCSGHTHKSFYIYLLSKFFPLINLCHIFLVTMLQDFIFESPPSLLPTTVLLFTFCRLLALP